MDLLTVIGLLKEDFLCPNSEDLLLPNLVRGFVYKEKSRLRDWVLDKRAMELSLEDYFVTPEGRNIMVYTSLRNILAHRNPGEKPDFVYTAKIVVPGEVKKNPLLDLPFYFLDKNQQLQLCQDSVNSG